MTVLLDRLCFGEGPRVRDGQLWLSDMHAQEVIRVSPEGVRETVVSLPDDQPSGLGWLPDGDLLIVGMSQRRLLRFDGTQLTEYADLSGLARWHCNDMVVDRAGRAYVGNFGFDLHNQASPAPAEIICVPGDADPFVAADAVMFPNGTVISPDDSTLIVGETFGGKLTAFDKHTDGTLHNRRTWAELPQGALPDGICLDAADGIWVASPTTNECIRLAEGGKVTHRITLDRGAFACMIGGDTLYVLTSHSSVPQECIDQRSARVETFPAPFPAAGWP
ncbi:MAG: SMP-30/gluconolactonase/LRE family protein [Pseudomonadota bacterium]